MIFTHYYENLSHVHFLTKPLHICEAWVDHPKNSLKYYYPHVTAQETEVYLRAALSNTTFMMMTCSVY